jgi:hypothetical protein
METSENRSSEAVSRLPGLIYERQPQLEIVSKRMHA